MPEIESSKVYVNVVTKFTKDGLYEIKRATDVQMVARPKAGDVGIRYTYIVNGKESHLFYEDNNMWFIEEQ